VKSGHVDAELQHLATQVTEFLDRLHSHGTLNNVRNSFRHKLSRYYFTPPGGVRSIAIFVSVCLLTYIKKYQLSLTNSRDGRITANVLRTKVGAQCDKLATETS